MANCVELGVSRKRFFWGVGSLHQPIPLHPVLGGWFHYSTVLILSTGQDEKNQMMTTNVWLKQVRSPLLVGVRIGEGAH